MIQQIKELKTGYYKPTPAKWRKVGDAIQESAIVAAAVIALFAAPPAWVSVLIFAAGRIGKIITNFATE
ncbi:MAG: hypothetical protein WC401_10225 [Bacteroidales bacterium]